jgi:hypothetical protein
VRGTVFFTMTVLRYPAKLVLAVVPEERKPRGEE